MAISLDLTFDIAALRQQYRFLDDDTVTAYLQHHPQLVSLLSEAAAQVPEYFPPDTSLRLQVFDDPDDDGEDPKLYAVVETEITVPMAEARSRLYRFRDDWWQHASRDVIRLISLVVE